MAKESVILRECLEFLAKHRLYCWRQNTGAFSVDGRWIRYGHPGCADIIGIAPDGRFLAVETKAPGRKQRTDQEIFERMVTRNNGIYILAHSAQALSEALKRHGIL